MRGYLGQRLLLRNCIRAAMRKNEKDTLNIHMRVRAAALIVPQHFSSKIVMLTSCRIIRRPQETKVGSPGKS
jgi:hypothetical protein